MTLVQQRTMIVDEPDSYLQKLGVSKEELEKYAIDPSYLGDVFNRIDGLVVIMSLLSFLPGAHSLRISRAFRPLRILVKKFQNHEEDDDIANVMIRIMLHANTAIHSKFFKVNCLYPRSRRVCNDYFLDSKPKLMPFLRFGCATLVS